MREVGRLPRGLRPLALAVVVLAASCASPGPGPLRATIDAAGWAWVDRDGRVVARPFVIDNGPDPFREGRARVVENRRVGFIDERGQVVIPPRYRFAGPFQEGRAAVCLDCREELRGEIRFWSGGRWGFLDRDGEMAIPPEYDEVRSFSGGVAEVRRGERWEKIDRAGRPAGGRERG